MNIIIIIKKAQEFPFEYLDVFLSWFEDAMAEAEVDEGRWPRHLETVLTVAALTKSIPEEKKRDYATLKNSLLNACGLSLSDFTLQFFTQGKKRRRPGIGQKLEEELSFKFSTSWQAVKC